MWKFEKFPAIQILRELNIEILEGQKLTFFKSLNFDIDQKQNSEHLKIHKSATFVISKMKKIDFI